MRILLKTLTEKSIIQYGKNEGLSVGDVLKKCKSDLIYTYFNYSNLTFTEEILEKLRIYPEDRISKPGRNPEKGKKYINRNIKISNKLTLEKHTNANPEDNAKLYSKYASSRRKHKAKASYKKLIETERKLFSKGSLQRINQGHR